MRDSASLLAGLTTALLLGTSVAEIARGVAMFHHAKSLTDEKKGFIERGVAQSEKLPGRPKGPPTLTFVHVTDTHHHRDDQEDSQLDEQEMRLQAFVDFCNTEIHPDFVVHTGDFVYPGRRGQIERCVRIMDHLTCPWIPVCGNHDGPDFTGLFGPANRSFDLKGWHWVVFPVLDTFRMREFSLRRAMNWIKADLAAHPDQPTVVFCHDPIVPLWDLARHHTLMEKSGNVVMVVSGHLHTDLKLVRQGITHITSWMFARSPHRFRVFEVYETGIWMTSYEEVNGLGAFQASEPSYFVPLYVSRKGRT